MKTNKILLYLSIPVFSPVLIAFASSGAGTVQISEFKAEETPKAQLERAKNLEKTASSAGEIKELIEAYKKVEELDPGNYLALWKIGNYHILLGAAHSESKKNKKYHYNQAIKYCEEAMFTNRDFANKMKESGNIIESAALLTIKEIDAMGYWYTARFYHFKEVLGPVGRIFNTSIVLDNNKVIALIDKLDPNWAGGGNYFSRALYYIATPKKFGGSKEKAAEELDLAIKAGPNYLVNRWGRAKYLYTVTKDKEAFIADMEWVVKQNPKECGNPYAWNIYFQKDAKKELNAVKVK